MYRNCPLCGQAFYDRTALKNHVVSQHGYDDSVHKHFETPDIQDEDLNAGILAATSTMVGDELAFDAASSEPSPSPEPEQPLETGGGDFGGAGASEDFSSSPEPESPSE